MSIPESKIFLSVYLAPPEVDNIRKSITIKNNLRKAKRDCIHAARAPIGYENKRIDRKRSSIVPADKAPLVAWVYEELAKDVLDTEAVRQLAIRKGLKVQKSYFHKVVRNPLYARL